MASEANREKTRERAAKDSRSRLLSRAALSWILATAPNGELAYGLKSNQQTWFQLMKREFPFANGLNNLFRTVITKKTLAQNDIHNILKLISFVTNCGFVVVCRDLFFKSESCLKTIHPFVE